MDMLASFSSESHQLFWGRVKLKFAGTASQGLSHTLLQLTVDAEHTASESKYNVKVIEGDDHAYSLVQLTLTKDQVWRKLASAPEDWTPHVTLTSQASLSPQDFACAAQQLLSMLCLRHGYLQFHFYLPNSDMTVAHCPPAPNRNRTCWLYEGQSFTCPPVLPVDSLAMKYRKIELWLLNL